MVRLLRFPAIQCVEREANKALRKASFSDFQTRSDKPLYGYGPPKKWPVVGDGEAVESTLEV